MCWWVGRAGEAACTVLHGSLNRFTWGSLWHFHLTTYHSFIYPTKVLLGQNAYTALEAGTCSPPCWSRRGHRTGIQAAVCDILLRLLHLKSAPLNTTAAGARPVYAGGQPSGLGPQHLLPLHAQIDRTALSITVGVV